MKDEARSLIAQQCARYPGLETQDLIKALYQAAMGCGHLAADEVRVLAGLRAEAAALRGPRTEQTEPIGGRFCRVHLAPFLQNGGTLPTMARLFALSSQVVGGGRPQLEAGLDALQEMADGGALPLAGETVRAALQAYRAAGCPAVHHSQAFRARYAPAYRVVCACYAAMLPLLARIDALRQKQPRVLVALDGPCASGKTTLAAHLARIYGATVVHMDDFFLRPEQRTPERLQTPGGNIDHERFYSEVLAPMRRGEAFLYRPYDCRTETVAQGTQVVPGAVCVIEGSYSLHPELERLYDLGVLLEIGVQEQSMRILRRNGRAQHARFLNEWIPLENLYFEKTNAAARCDLRLRLEADGEDA